MLFTSACSLSSVYYSESNLCDLDLQEFLKYHQEFTPLEQTDTVNSLGRVPTKVTHFVILEFEVLWYCLIFIILNGIQNKKHQKGKKKKQTKAKPSN